MIFIIHPHRKMDNFLACQKGLNDFISRNRRRVICVNKPRTKTYLDERNLINIESNHGPIETSVLAEHLTSNSEHHLLGGSVNQCHLEAFESICKYAMKHGLHNILIRIPYDLCFIQRSYLDGIIVRHQSFRLREVICYSLGTLIRNPRIRAERSQIDKERVGAILSKYYQKFRITRLEKIDDTELSVKIG